MQSIAITDKSLDNCVVAVEPSSGNMGHGWVDWLFQNMLED